MEAVVIIIVPLIALLIGAMAVLAPRPVDVVAERARLDQHIDWLEERLRHAREKHWDDQMVGQITTQLEAARRQRAMLPPA